jgi:hypothetical protein
MKFTWRSDSNRRAGKLGAEPDYASEFEVDSRAVPGVTLRIFKMSFGRRIELMRRVRELARHAEFLAAGKGTSEPMDAALMQAEIERTYVLWGVKEVLGLTVDHSVAGPAALIESGPETLFREALAAVRKEIGLSEEERKNS